jgi:hypothetical protein
MAFSLLFLLLFFMIVIDTRWVARSIHRFLHQRHGRFNIWEPFACV